MSASSTNSPVPMTTPTPTPESTPAEPTPSELTPLEPNNLSTLFSNIMSLTLRKLMTRRATIKEMETKLRATLKELEVSKALCEQLLQERDDTAWKAIKPETIQNCFKKAGFRNNVVDVVLEDEEPEILQGFPGYSSIDDNVAPYEIQSIEDLIKNVNDTQNEGLSENDEDEDESTPEEDNLMRPPRQNQVPPKKKKQTESTQIPQITKILNESLQLQKFNNDSDAKGNRAFLMSFVPIMDSMTPDLTMETRYEITNLFRNIQRNERNRSIPSNLSEFLYQRNQDSSGSSASRAYHETLSPTSFGHINGK
ncbi:unnamed protein product [Pieris macdunnoughi]|uniref:BESS domain-containing protein n=1 Tax=Pieris macdunnoughi TaxID=345717 RepID=A0A821XUV1_9NEOP|nr:unnamed protein product [Pieris macdunnoughi]